MIGGGDDGGANKGSSDRIREKVATYLAALRGGNDLLLDSSFSARCDNGELKEIRQVLLRRISKNMALETRLREAGARVMHLKVTFYTGICTEYCMAFDTFHLFSVFCFLFSAFVKLKIWARDLVGKKQTTFETNHTGR